MRINLNALLEVEEYSFPIVVSVSGTRSTLVGRPESAAFVWMRPAGVRVGRGTHQAGMGVAMVVEFFKFIHPHFGCPDAVGQSLTARVGGLLGENVAHVRARVCLQGPTALPDLRIEQGGGRVGEWGGGGEGELPASGACGREGGPRTLPGPHPPWGRRPPPRHIQDTERSQGVRTQPQRQALRSKIPKSMH